MVEDQVGAAVVESASRHQFGKSKYVHACSYCAGNADGTVFDYQATAGIVNSHGTRGVQVNIGVRFTAFDVAGTKDTAFKKTQQAGFTQRHSHLLMRTARRDAIG